LTECWQIQDNTVLYGAIAPIDIDGDVDLDAVVGNYDNARSDSTRIFMNDGTGAFTMVAQKLRPTAWGKFTLGDFNGDGRTDVFVSNFNLPNEIWLNEEGHLTDSGERLGGNEPSGKSALGDLDNDGDLDLFVAFFGEGSNSVWFNNSN
jgi:hypothetical protein